MLRETVLIADTVLTVELHDDLRYVLRYGTLVEYSNARRRGCGCARPLRGGVEPPRGGAAGEDAERAHAAHPAAARADPVACALGAARGVAGLGAPLDLRAGQAVAPQLQECAYGCDAVGRPGRHRADK